MRCRNTNHLGIGYGICFICTFIACFYNAVIAHAVYFFLSSIAVWQLCTSQDKTVPTSVI